MNVELIQKASHPLAIAIAVGLGALESATGIPMWISVPCAAIAIVLARYVQLKREEAKAEAVGE